VSESHGGNILAMRVAAVVTCASVLALISIGAAQGPSRASVVAFSRLPHQGVVPPSMPQHLRGVARELTLSMGHSVWLAPTRNGNFCEAFSYGFGGCRVRTLPSSFTPRQRASLRIGDTVEARNNTAVAIGGDLLAVPGSTLTLVFADGARQNVPVVFVSAPISAGFYALTLSPAHQRQGHTPIRLTAADARGKVIASTSISAPH
jgi:hypothetical protein